MDILYAARMFKNHVIVKPDFRKEHGEVRFRALGYVNSEFFVLIFTMRDDVARLITAWKAGKNGEKEYKIRVSG